LKQEKKHDERLRPSEKIEVLDVHTKYLDFVDTDDDSKMHTFEHEGETVDIPDTFFGEKGAYLKEGIQIAVRYIEDSETPIN